MRRYIAILLLSFLFEANLYSRPPIVRFYHEPLEEFGSMLRGARKVLPFKPKVIHYEEGAIRERTFESLGRLRKHIRSELPRDDMDFGPTKGAENVRGHYYHGVTGLTPEVLADISKSGGLRGSRTEAINWMGHETWSGLPSSTIVFETPMTIENRLKIIPAASNHHLPHIARSPLDMDLFPFEDMSAALIKQGDQLLRIPGLPKDFLNKIAIAQFPDPEGYMTRVIFPRKDSW